MIRNDFVSNSSSSSFIIDKARHYGEFKTALNILQKSADDTEVSSISIFFNDKINIDDLFKVIKCSENYINFYENFWCDLSIRKESKKPMYILNFNMPIIIQHINNNLIDHAISLCVHFNDDEPSISVDHIHKELEKSISQFEWYR